MKTKQSKKHCGDCQHYESDGKCRSAACSARVVQVAADGQPCECFTPRKQSAAEKREAELECQGFVEVSCEISLAQALFLLVALGDQGTTDAAVEDLAVTMVGDAFKRATHAASAECPF